MEKTGDKYPCPGNVEGLRTLRVNPLIWNQIPSQTCTSDSKSQKSQSVLVASIVAMIKATTLVLKSRDADATVQSKELVSMLTDAITLAMQCFHKMNSVRHQAKIYVATARPSAIIQKSCLLQSTYLEKSKLTKDVSNANKLARKVTPQHVEEANGKFSMSSQCN